jgi:predicted transcriptional regulator
MRVLVPGQDTIDIQVCNGTMVAFLDEYTVASSMPLDASPKAIEIACTVREKWGKGEAASEELRSLFVELGITASEFAKMMLVTPTSVSRWVHGGARVRRTIIKRFSALFNL